MISLLSKNSFLSTLLHPYFFLNIFACSAYIASKNVLWICEKVYPQDDICQLDWRDQEILIFLCFIIAIKNRRWKPTMWTEYMSNVFMFTKCANFLLFCRKDYRFAVAYMIFCLGLFIVTPEPKYKGPENITYFRGQALEEELLMHPKNVYVVEFFASWSSPCTHFTSVFADLSLQYSDDYLKFGKLDIGRYPQIAKRFNIETSVTSKQLPTLILFVNGKEVLRKPFIDNKSTVWKYSFTKENILRDYSLNEHLQESKAMKKKYPKGSNDTLSTQVKKSKDD